MNVRPSPSHVCRPVTSRSNSKSTPSLDNLPAADCPPQTPPTTPTPTYQSNPTTPPISLSLSTSPHTPQCDQHLAVQRLAAEHVRATSTSPGLDTTLESCPCFGAWNWDCGSPATENAHGTNRTTIDKGKPRTRAARNGRPRTPPTTAIFGQQSKNATADEQDQKRRKLTAPEDTLVGLPLALVEDIGERLGVGGTGQVFKYKSDLVLKVYEDSKPLQNELRAYSLISASLLRVPTPHIEGKILLPQSFLSRQFNNDGKTYTPYHYGLVLERLQGPLLCDLLDEDHFNKLKLDILEEEVKKVVRRLHDIGISHGDIKGNNLMFRVLESEGWSINTLNTERSDDWCLDNFDVEKQCPVSKIDGDREDWCIFDFGHAVFVSDCSSKAWERQCWIDEVNLEEMFNTTKAQLAITFLTQHLEDVTSTKTSFPITPQPLNQELLLPILRTTKALPRAASDLITTTILPRLSSTPSLDLASLIINIFCSACRFNQARTQINSWLREAATSSSTSNPDNNNHHRETIIFLHLRKIKLLCTFNYSVNTRIKALRIALDTMKDYLILAGDLRVLSVRRELSLLLFDQGKRGEAWRLFEDCVREVDIKRREGEGDAGKEAEAQAGGAGRDKKREEEKEKWFNEGNARGQATILLQEWKQSLVEE